MLPEDLELLVVDDRDAAERVEALLREAGVAVDGAGPGVAVHHRESLAGALAWLERRKVEVDLVLLGCDHREGVERFGPTVPVVVTTETPDEELGVEAVARGAQDYLVGEELTPRALVRSLRHAVERHRATARSRRRNEELRTLLHLTRHGVRNDASLVVAGARELADHVDERGTARLDEVAGAGAHVVELTRAAGDAADALAGTDDPELIPVDLARALEPAIARADGLFDDHAVEFEGDLPDVAVRADECLASAVGALLGDAVRHASAETSEGTVAVAAGVDGDRVVLRVAVDGGVPLPRGEAALDSGGARGDEHARGGVGYYLLGRLAERYGGSVRVEDGDGEGTVAVVELPRATGDEGPGAADEG